MKHLGLVLPLLLLLLPVLAADITMVIGSIDTDGTVVEGEYFSLTISYTIFNSDSDEISVDSAELELQLPDSVMGTTEMDLPTVVVPAKSSVTEQIVVQNLKAIDHGTNQKIVVNIQAEGEDATSSFVFDIAESTTFSLNLYPEDPSVGQWVRVSGDVWPVKTIFVGKDSDGNDVLIQNRTMGGEYSPQLVLIVTPWGTYKTMSDFRGTFTTFIPALQHGEHMIIATMKDGKTATRTLKVKGFSVDMEAVPDKLILGESATLIGRVQVPGLSKVPVELNVGGKKKALVTDIHGIFQTTVTPDRVGEFQVTAVVTWSGKYATEEILIEVESVESSEDDQLKILPSMPTSVLAGTTVNIKGTIVRGGLVPALMTVTLPTETNVVNSTDGNWSLNFVAPHEPGFYSILIEATDSFGTNTKEVQLRVVPFSESIIEVHPNKPQYAPQENATITYSIDLTHSIDTEAEIRVRWYGQVIYEESRPFSEKLNGTIEMQLDPGDYEVEVEALGNIKKTRFQAFTKPGSETTLESENTVSLASNLTIPVIVGAILAALVVLV
jgi:hypothetical protein